MIYSLQRYNFFSTKIQQTQSKLKIEYCGYEICCTFVPALKEKIMATITINYDSHNKNITTLLDVIINLGAIPINTTYKTEIDEALDDVKKGRIYTATDAKSLINQCLQ